MAKQTREPVESAFNVVAGFFATVFAVVFFVPFVGLGIAIGYWIWG